MSRGNGSHPASVTSALILDADEGRQIALRARLRETRIFDPLLSARSVEEAGSLVRSTGIDIVFVHWRAALGLMASGDGHGIFDRPSVLCFDEDITDDDRADLGATVPASAVLDLPATADSVLAAVETALS